jgi:hypothetical protein
MAHGGDIVSTLRLFKGLHWKCTAPWAIKCKKETAMNSRKPKTIHATEFSCQTPDANVFNCFAPLYFFEKTRKKCPHEGHCREEGLLLALLTGKKKLDYNQRVPI